PTAPIASPEGARAAPVFEEPLLIATDGTRTASGALAIGKVLAGSTTPLHILSVVEPTPVLMPVPEVPIYSPGVEVARAESLRQQLAAEVRSTFGQPPPSVEVLIGSPVHHIARRARELGAGMVLTGLRHHGRLERVMLRRETPLALARQVRIPVLVVPEGTTRLPRSVLVAAAIDQASADAARRARPLLAEAETVYVVHVRSRDTYLEGDAARSWQRVYDNLAQDAFDRIVAALDLPPAVHVETRTLTGHVVEELLDFAEAQHVELIVAGFHRQRLIDRLAGPRHVAERVLRGTSCAMLLVPERSGADLPLGVETRTDIVTNRMVWADQLAEFASRNLGRRSHLEIDTLSLGSQAQVSEWLLLGIEYDESSAAVRMMFGATEGGGPHLTHNIPRPQSVEIQRRRDGKDVALRIGHEGGYTLLTFE
ncbi:MAG TPA: universal stress protein, partial [Gemmatimonadaceae bacterium]|nr:universal stress protein [Gemmatimonadaceae bacterium]